MLQRSILILLFLAGTLFSQSLFSQCNPTADSLALVAFYNATGGPDWNDNSNWLVPGQSLSTWANVNVNDDGCVIYLGGSNNNLVGSIPSEIGELRHLKTISMYNNQLTGPLPPEIGQLTALSTLYIQYNDLTGSLPAEIGNMTVLGSVNIEYNNFSGTLPVELADIPLVVFVASGNNFTGEIPSEFGQLSNLNILLLGFNQLTGTLPVELTNCTELGSMSINDNQLYGCFPDEYADFCDLYIVDFSNNIGLPNNGDFDIFCENGVSECNLTIEGVITYDENQNCAADGTEVGLENWMVKATSVDGEFYGLTDVDGHYNIYTSAGDYDLELIPPGPYWDENCSNPAMVTIGADLAVDTVDFFPNPIVECPYLSVDISTPFLRRCFANTYVVNYCNDGTAIAEDAILTVNFHELINIDSASVSIISEIDNTLTFELGDIGINECGSFLIYTNVSCDAELGQGLCATAHILPDSICAPSPEWSGANLVINSRCDGEEAQFLIKNIGEGNMLMEQSFIVIEDAIIMLQSDPFLLNSGEELEVTLPANGSTYTCRTNQVANHPVSADPIASIEACGFNSDGGFSIGFLNQFPTYDDAAFVSVDCQEVVGAFDPNDKNGFPRGYGTEHFIEKGQNIEYHIRFQNTGTDTAFTVMIEDVISADLDMSTFRQGVSSHPYTVKIVNDNTLKFLFENILLPDSTANEPASHGFVKFKIYQKPDLALGTQIENTASIFFDFNEAVVTNTTLHTLGSNFLQIVATKKSFIPNLKVVLAPNPMVDYAIIRLEGVAFKNAQIALFNNIGLLVKKETFNGDEFLLRKGDLPAGIYFYEVEVDGMKGGVGKVVVQ